MEGIFHKLEHLTKVLLFDCKDCGDCALIDIAYLCPMSQCPKNQRNGACGGSFQGWCEVYPEKKTVHLCPGLCPIEETRGGSASDKDIVPPCNWDLYQTSSWINYYLGKDHTSKKQS